MEREEETAWFLLRLNFFKEIASYAQQNNGKANDNDKVNGNPERTGVYQCIP